MDNPTPVQAFFGQTQSGNSRWWTWLAVFWFAIVIWFYGQVILAIPMFIISNRVAPGGLETLMAEAANTGKFQKQAETITTYTVFLFSILAILLWFLPGKPGSKSRNTVLRIAAGCVALSTVALVYLIKTGFGGGEMAEVTNNWISISPVLYLLILLTFPPLAIGLWLGQKHVHKRSILSLHTAAPRFRWERTGFAMIVFWFIAAALSCMSHVSGFSEAEFVFDPGRFWAYLPITLLCIPLQSATEEIALRGYLNQGLGHYISNPWLVFFITSAAFAALHLANPEITNADTPAFIAISGYFFFGMFACILTCIDGGLESAIGVHAANNIFATSMVGYENSALPTPTVFRTPLNTGFDNLMVIVSLSLVCLVLFLTRKSLELTD